MSVSEALVRNILQSKVLEIQIQADRMQDLFDQAWVANGVTYDLSFQVTNGFRSITAGAIMADSRIIKTLRYVVTPSLSQMKCGQLFELSSVGRFEQSRVLPSDGRHRELSLLAPRFAAYVNERLDRERFLWLHDPTLDTPLARRYARNWTISLAADQNSQTSFRNWRKDHQEEQISAYLLGRGFTLSDFRGVVTSPNDLRPGEFIHERKVQGSGLQKADVVCRSATTQGLVLIEAKAVGVLIDATKRTKEVCDKAHEWRGTSRLGNPRVVAVIAGFFHPSNILSLETAGVDVVWEHHLEGLSQFL